MSYEISYRQNSDLNEDEWRSVVHDFYILRDCIPYNTTWKQEHDIIDKKSALVSKSKIVFSPWKSQRQEEFFVLNKNRGLFYGTVEKEIECPNAAYALLVSSVLMSLEIHTRGRSYLSNWTDKALAIEFDSARIKQTALSVGLNRPEYKSKMLPFELVMKVCLPTWKPEKQAIVTVNMLMGKLNPENLLDHELDFGSR